MIYQAKELSDIFFEYENKFESKDLNEIVSRKFVYSKLDLYAEILICGINPSYRKNEKNCKGYSFNFSDLTSDRYFKTFHLLFEPYKSLYRIDYFDLFYQRHTSQSDIFKFYSEKKGIEFLCKQLEITNKTIETIKPKAIFVFNKHAANYFGKNYSYNKKTKMLQNVWLGYKFKDIDINNTFKIDGLIDTSERLNFFDLKNTNLNGTIVYFSRFLNRFTPKKELLQIRKDIERIFIQIRNK